MSERDSLAQTFLALGPRDVEDAESASPLGGQESACNVLSSGQMPSGLAIIAEHDRGMRRLLKAVLERVDYRVLECASELDFAAQFDRSRLDDAQPLLLVLNVELTASFLSQVDQVARGRLHSPGMRVILICEFGAADRAPAIDAGHWVALLEKPFDLDEFEILACACSAAFEEASSDALVNEMADPAAMPE